MRALAVAFLLAGLAVAGQAIGATPTQAASSALTLSVGQQLYVLPTARLHTYVPVQFQIGGRAGRTVEVWHCRNGHYAPNDMWLSWPPCSSGDSVFSTGDWEDTFSDEFGDAGRYESYARASGGELSNRVTFTILDECRWTVLRDQQTYEHSDPGMPYHCDHLRTGPLELRADDGSRLISTGYGSAVRNRYYPSQLSTPDLRFGVGDLYNKPAVGSLRLKLGPTIGSYLIHVNTPNAVIVTTGRVEFRVSHLKRLTRIHVYSGKVVVTANTFLDYDLGDWVEQVCHRKVSFRCLRKVPRTITLKRGQTRKVRHR